MSGLLLADTCVLSALAKKRFDHQLELRVSDAIDAEVIAISAITFYEIRRGSIRLVEEPKKASILEGMLEVVPSLPVSDFIAGTAARMHSDARGNGIVIADADLLIAATAVVTDAVLLTTDAALVRNLKRIPLAPSVELYPANVAAS